MKIKNKVGNLVRQLAFIIGIVGYCSFLTSCNAAHSKALAEQGVSEFHSQLDAESYQQIYSAADQGFKNVTSEREFTALLEAIHKKLGAAREFNLQGFQTGWFAGKGNIITLNYHTKFAGGDAAEQFIWHVDGERASLLGYHISSNALILK